MLNLRATLAAALLWLVCVPAFAGSGCAPIITGAVLTAAQWQQCFQAKQDDLGYVPLNTAGGVMTGRLITAAPGASTAGFNLTPGSTPGAPVNGDLWITSSGIFAQVNGSTLTLLSGSAATFAATDPLDVSFPGGVVTYGLNYNSSLALDGSSDLGVNLGHSNTWTATQTFPNNSLTLAEFPTFGANTVLGSIAGGTPINLSKIQLTSLINPATSSLSGALPAWPNSTTTFFRGDGTYQTLNFGALSGSATASQLPSGVTTNTLNTQTANYTIATTDCGKTVQAGTGSTGQFTITLPTVTGFASNCVLTIQNGDTGNGKILSGFPSGLTSPSILWPQQTLQVGIVNGAWEIMLDPGRWRRSSPTLYVNTSGSDTTNDGLTSSTPFSTIQHCVTVLLTKIDSQGSRPACIGASGQTFSECVSVFGPMPQTNSYLLIQGAGSGFTWRCPGGVPLSVGDFQSVIVDNIYFGGGTETGIIFLHNQANVDFGLPGTCGPALGFAGNASMSYAISNNGSGQSMGLNCSFTWSGNMTAMAKLTANFVLTVSPGITITFGGGAVTDIFEVDGPGDVYFPGAMTWSPAAGDPIYASIRQFAIWGHGTIENYSGVTIPGFSGAAGAAGAYCTSSTACATSMDAGYINSGTLGYARFPAFAHSQSTPATKSPTSSTTFVMNGYAGSITPTASGTVHVSIQTYGGNSTAGDACSVKLAYGTGTAPANGAAATGTAVGNPVTLISQVSTPVTAQGTITGLTPGTTYWLDLQFEVVTGGTCFLNAGTITADELP